MAKLSSLCRDTYQIIPSGEYDIDKDQYRARQGMDSVV